MATTVLEVIFQLAIILLFAKGFGLLARRIGLPEVVGNIVAGLILGMIPVLALFFIFQDMIMEKVYIGGLKG